MQLKIKIFSILFFLNLFIGFSQNEGTINIESSPTIQSAISKRVDYNKSNPKIDGFRIQLFNGSESGATRTRSKFQAVFPNTTTSIDWVTPEWRVRVGKYKTRLEVDKAFEEIKLIFGSAMIVNMKIHI